MAKDFYTRFNIEIGLDEARRRFVNRAQNLVFTDLLGKLNSIDRDYRFRILMEIATSLGEPYFYNSSAKDYTKENFQRTLEAIEAFYKAMPFNQSSLDDIINRLIKESEVNLSIHWKGGRFSRVRSPDFG